MRDTIRNRFVAAIKIHDFENALKMYPVKPRTIKIESIVYVYSHLNSCLNSVLKTRFQCIFYERKSFIR